MTLKLGNSAKDSKYLKRIKDAIEGDKSHPRNNGVKMQAHHAISAEGMKRSGLGKKIEKFGYDINLLPNLVFIPCTLQGACYLGVQPHRGNHTAVISQDDYDDDLEPMSYHDLISLQIKDLGLPLAKECQGADDSRVHEIRRKLDGLSKYIITLIQKKPADVPLTNIAGHFSPRSPIGCGGVDSVSAHHGLSKCAVERMHAGGRQSAKQKDENITYRSDRPYQLKPGN
ncbi:hypothetical protein FHW83_005785 [Duganella sp. SG902]|uniref:AHH domain-containing protein n=1 Tax=Duganella sp. SG902 TaxID=2587016 RepID=UPI00159E8810|nr:AHH domain-containing protein [Duganella sp. SG902]NVM79943.1 hypothetical protein [Duganella sp. SG902]